MTAHEPINFLDSILSEEEKRCEYNHQWRNFSISRSGRFKSKNKKRNVVDGQLFDSGEKSKDACSSNSRQDMSYKEQDKYNVTRQQHISNAKSLPQQQQQQQQQHSSSHDRSYYETNL